MFTIDAPAPAQRDGIGQAIATALGIDVGAVVLVGDRLHIDAGDSAHQAAQDVVRTYAPPVPPVDPVIELVASVDKATTVAAIRSALVKGLPPALRAR